jgi:uncharacterized membrane protein
MNYELITKKELIAAIDKFPPKKWIKFAFRFASQNPNDKFIARKAVSYYLVGMVGVMVILGMFDIPMIYWYVLLSLYGVVLFGLIGLIFTASLVNDKRIDKVRKELGEITKDEYSMLVNKFNL